ncbi:MAG: RHS repeat domain-containing protein, partial [Lentisphaeria bacterium]
MRKIKLLNPLRGQTLVKTETGIWDVKYNCENRPVLWSCENKTIEMSFDYMGRRVFKKVFENGEEISHERFFYKDFVLVEILGTTTENGKKFIWDPTESVATRPLKMETQNGDFYYTHDANKNVTAITTAAGDLVQSYDYKTFGRRSLISHQFSDSETLSENLDGFTNPFQFSSEYYDSELNLVYYNYRHYNPEIGRWISRDPIEEQGGVNLYNFVQNNAVNAWDVLGLSKCFKLLSTRNMDITIEYLNQLG